MTFVQKLVQRLGPQLFPSREDSTNAGPDVLMYRCRRTHDSKTLLPLKQK